MLNYGTGNPRFNNAPGSLDFTPTTHCIMTKKEPRSEDITRFSQITTANKYFEIGSHLELSYRIYNLTKAQIDALEAVIGETIQFYPHSDAGVSFSALVLNVQPKMEKNLAFLYYVDITVLSVNYFKFGTNLTLTSPNGSEVLQRNQVFNITWTSYGITGNVALELWKNGSKLSDIDTSEVNDGTYAWTVPADATIGTDYQIKILNSTGYIYDFSDANFTIDYDGYYFPDGDNDYVKIPITNLGNTFSICLFYKDFTPANGNDMLLISDDSKVILQIDAVGTLQEVVFKTINADYGFAGTTAIPTSSSWRTLIITCNITGTAYGIFHNNVADASVTQKAAPPQNLTFGYLKLFAGTGDSVTGKFKHILITSDVLTETERGYFQAQDILKIDNKVFWYKCNEADTGAPYTDKAVDSSGNGNHGTPINITGATFFNQS